ncbi:Fic/DOC family protein [Labrys okinawensis]|uniref:Fic/DOC family protein n=1 Tax=Labrys okinawensis TaxID=346911 RepID=UPI0039BD611F
MTRSSTEAATYNRYFYIGSEPRVPINKLGIKDRALLEEAEGLLVELRVAQGLPRKALQLTYAGFKAIHHHLFQDLFDWAGKERTYTTARNPIVSFAQPEHITGWMEAQFISLRGDNYLRGLDRTVFAQKAAVLVNEINAAHPFIDGNGRVQRLWLQIVAEQAGYRVEIHRQDREAWNEAARIGFLRSSEPMARFIFERMA